MPGFEAEALRLLRESDSWPTGLHEGMAPSTRLVPVVRAYSPDGRAGVVGFAVIRKDRRWQAECVVAERADDDWTIVNSSGAEWLESPIARSTHEQPAIALELRTDGLEAATGDEIVAILGTSSSNEVVALAGGMEVARVPVARLGIFATVMVVEPGAEVELRRG